MENESKIVKSARGNKRWSQLPTTLIFIIKDRLNFVDNVRLAVVCKHWNLASASYTRQRQRRLVPFLLCQGENRSTCIFRNVSTMKENLVCDIPEFGQPRASLLSSKGGWLLIGTSDVDNFLSSSVMLLHLQTSAKIVMPVVEENIWGLCGSFSSTADGAPSYVVVANCGVAELTLYVANVGDEKWMKYVHASYIEFDNKYRILVVGSKAYFLDANGGTIAFDKSNLRWAVTQNPNPRYEREENKIGYLVESEEGVIFKVIESKDTGTFRFFKLNEMQCSWEELSESDNVGRSWFLSQSRGPHSNFTIKEDARVCKIYKVGVWMLMKMKTQILFRDLIENSMRKYEVDGTAEWVDLGRVDNRPPSCVLYKPSPQV